MLNAVQPGPIRNPIRVWDVLIRACHWALVVAFTIAYLTGEEEGTPDLLHVWSGYAVGAIIAIRLIWGFAGAGHARFSDFAFGPISAIRYLIDLMSGRARRFIGHSPAGAAMVFALLLSLSATVVTGLIAYVNSGHGPLAAAQIVSTAHAEERAHGGQEAGRKEGGDSAVGDLHAVLANITLALVILHILGVGLASLAHRENLLAGMITGLKRPPDAP